MSVASMPMYDLPELRMALDSLWRGFATNAHREGLGEVPKELVHGRHLDQLWNDPELWFSQLISHLRPMRPVRMQRCGKRQCRLLPVGSMGVGQLPQIVQLRVVWMILL